MPHTPFPLHATAALVMQWGYPVFSGRAKTFVDHLDLTAARDLIVSCELHCPWYGEVIANRKAAIRYMATDYISAAGGPVTVLIPAAGWSPLALELVEAVPGIIQVIELDIAGMEEKRELYKKTAPDLADRIRCITRDITDPGILREYLPDNRQTVLVILEGITYFMDSDWVERLIRTCSGPHDTGYIIEYLLPPEEIESERSLIADHVFSEVAAACACPPPVRYSPGQLSQTASESGYEEIMTMTVREMEILRTGENRYFLKDSDGWIAISMIRK